MELNFTLTRRKRTVLFYSAIILFLQSIAPALHGAMAQSAQGFTDIVCTMYGPVEVFVEFETDTEEQKRDCDECTRCILQVNLNAAALHADFQFAANLLPLQTARAAPVDQTPQPSLYGSFLSRAPPL